MDGRFYRATITDIGSRFVSVKYEDDGYDRVFPKAEADTSIVLDIQPEARDCTIGCSLIAKPRRVNYMLEGRLVEVQKGQRYKVSVLETGESEVKMKRNIRLMNKFNFEGKCVVVCSILGVFKLHEKRSTRKVQSAQYLGTYGYFQTSLHSRAVAPKRSICAPWLVSKN